MKKAIFILIALILLFAINGLLHSIYDLWHKQDLLTTAQKELVSEKLKNKKIKAGIIGMMMNVALELKPYNIHTTSYCPGGVASKMKVNNATYRPAQFGGAGGAVGAVHTPGNADGRRTR